MRSSCEPTLPPWLPLLPQEHRPELAVSTSPWLPINPAELISQPQPLMGGPVSSLRLSAFQPPPHASPSSPATTSDPYHIDSRTRCHGIPSCRTSLHSPSRSTVGHGDHRSQSDSRIGQRGRSAAGMDRESWVRDPGHCMTGFNTCSRYKVGAGLLRRWLWVAVPSPGRPSGLGIHSGG